MKVLGVVLLVIGAFVAGVWLILRWVVRTGMKAVEEVAKDARYWR